MSDQITELDIDQIQKRIPHRPPMLLIERVEEIVPDHSAVGAVSYTHLTLPTT